MWFLQKLNHSMFFDHAKKTEYELWCEILFAHYSLLFYFDKEEAKNAKLNNCFYAVNQNFRVNISTVTYIITLP